MADKGPPKVKLIAVKPAADDGETLPPLQSKNVNAVVNTRIASSRKGRINSAKPHEMTGQKRHTAETDNAAEREKKPDSNGTRHILVEPCGSSEHDGKLGSSFRDVEMPFAKHVKDLPVVKEEDFLTIVRETAEDLEDKRLINELKRKTRKKKKRIKKNAVLPLDVTKSDYLEGQIEEPREEINIGEPVVRNDKKKTKKKDKSKKKKKKKEKTEQASQSIETTNREPEPEVAAAPPRVTEHADDKKKARKLPCCFGFISTWIAKRKQKRRDKKKKAIAERATPSKLVQYEHKKAKGGEAFTIEVDCRPIIQGKPVLPPIKQNAVPIRRGTDNRLQTADERRLEELAKRLKVPRTYEMKKKEDTEETDNVAEREKKSDSRPNGTRHIIVEPCGISEHERQLDSSFREVEMPFAKHVKDLPVVKEEDFLTIVRETAEDLEDKKLINELKRKTRKKKKRIKKNAILPLDVTKSDYLEGQIEEPREEINIGEPVSRNGKTKKTKKKDKSKKKKKKKEKTEQASQSIETTNREPEPEVAAEPPQVTEHADDKKKARKLPCCFGFISTWIAKRKQKRRDKKKKAIAERATPPKLAQYEHKKAKGGEAFTIEIDCRPIIQGKPVLPPIKQNAGPIRRGTDNRLQTADERRLEELAKRLKVPRTYEMKKIECNERKADAENNFRKKAGLTIRYKQADAERNRNNLSRRARPRRPASIQSSSCESVIIESDPDAFKVHQSDPDAWKVDDVDCFSY